MIGENQKDRRKTKPKKTFPGEACVVRRMPSGGPRRCAVDGCLNSGRPWPVAGITSLSGLLESGCLCASHRSLVLEDTDNVLKNNREHAARRIQNANVDPLIVVRSFSRPGHLASMQFIASWFESKFLYVVSPKNGIVF